MIRQGRYISLIKAASKASAAAKGGEVLGKALGLAGKSVKKTHNVLGEIGENVAKGLKIDPRKGRIAGKAILPTAGTVGAAETEKGKQLRARHGVLTPSEYGGYF